ncbi:MAG TPA: sensor domain-containing protein [Solirubrobacteraceae bacterium]|nr:sensor domain-containing protein [Solirubrobacteraceae bacterium]
MGTTIRTGSAWRSLLRPLITTGGWTAVTHHLLGLPLGIVYFTWLVTGLATGVGLAITIVGIPLLTAVLASVRPLLAFESELSNALLGTRIPRSSLAPAPRADGWFAQLKAYWTDGPTWRGVLYLLGRLPVGTFTFTVALSTYASALYLIAAPIVAPFDAVELGFWQPDTWYEGMALVPVGVVLLVISGWISEALAALSRAFARWGTRDTPRYL